jgi:hypothetical protein
MYLLMEASQAEESDIPVASDGPSYGRSVHVRTFLGSSSKAQRGPQAFSVEFTPGHVIGAHFHSSDQFQVFVSGRSRVGKLDLDPVTVQYADSSTTYGPIYVSDDEPMVFYNFRAHSDIGQHYMPGSRDKMVHDRGRLIHVRADLRLGEDLQPNAVARLTLIELAEDGLAAYETRASASTVLPRETVGGSGCFGLVLDGSMLVDGVPVTRDGVAFAAAGDQQPVRRAGPDGLRLLELQLPAL